MHHGIGVGGLVEGQLLNAARIGNELSQHCLLLQKQRVVLDVGRRRHVLRQVHDVGVATHVFEFALSLQFLANSEQIHGMVAHAERLHGLIDFLVAWLIERLGLQDFRDERERILVDHQCAKHDALNVESLWLKMAVGIVNGRRITPFLAIGVCILWHRIVE